MTNRYEEVDRHDLWREIGTLEKSEVQGFTTKTWKKKRHIVLRRGSEPSGRTQINRNMLILVLRASW